jgi:hypothetical protein
VSRRASLAAVVDTPNLFPEYNPPAGPNKRHRILTASEPVTELPAIVTRSGVVVSVPIAAVAEVVRRGVTRAVTVDVEHSGYPIGHRDYELRLIQLGGADVAVVFDARDPAQRMVAAELLAAAPVLQAYSATADLVPLVHAGLTTFDSAWDRMHDVVIPVKLATPEAVGTAAGLKATSAVMLSEDAVSPAADAAREALFVAGDWSSKVDVTDPVTKSGWAQVDPRWTTMVRYAAADVLDTAAIAERVPAPPTAVLTRERALQKMTARITHVGLPLDYDHIMSLLAKHTAERDVAAQRVTARGVVDPGSGPCVAAALTAVGAQLPLTDKGNPSVEASVLSGLRAAEGRVGELVDAILTYRKHAMLVSTFLEPYRALCEHGDGRVRPTVYTLSARTGRMSSVRPNAQNVPREGLIRACWTADLLYLLISADLAGIEMRVAAALSGDPVMTRAVVEGRSSDKTDLHWLVAKQVFGENATKSDRYLVKPGVYGRFYGGGAATLSAEMGCTLEIAEAVVETLDALTPDYTRWAQKMRHRVDKGHATYELYNGVQLQLPRAHSFKAPNYIIQRTAREILVDALLKWRDTRWGNAVITPIHDEIVAMVPAEEAVEATAVLVECMTTELLGVPITASANEPSFAWADAA